MRAVTGRASVGHCHKRTTIRFDQFDILNNKLVVERELAECSHTTPVMQADLHICDSHLRNPSSYCLMKLWADLFSVSLAAFN